MKINPFDDAAAIGQPAVEDRRRFMRLLSATMGTACLAACGGGADAVEPTSTPAPLPTPAPTSPPTPAPTPAPVPPPAPPASGAREFTLTGAAGGEHPFTLGYVFKAGEVPAGSFAHCTLPASQVIVKNTWPDGSAKFALVSGRATMASATPLKAQFSVDSVKPVGLALSTAQLRETGVVAGVNCGPFGDVNWAGVDWDSPFLNWVSGPQMSSWIYRKAVGSDVHLVAWLEVRLWAGGAVEILPWIENGYVRVLGPINKAATYTFILGGTQRFTGAIDLPHHCRTPLLAGAALSHWLGADPGVVVRHDQAYLQATKLVPSYRAVVAANAEVVARLPSTFTPLQVGSFTATMGVAGYQPSIGLLPEWDVLYLTSSSNAPWAALQRNGYSAGRWGIHYRDEKTQRPMRFSDFPNISRNASTTGDFIPAESGTAAPYWDIPHHPSVGYLAYLVTGRFFHMEEVLFAATRNYLHQVNSLRQYSAGIFLSQSGASTTRGAAWAIRTLAQAATVVPDDDPLRADFLASLEANVNYNHARYVAQPNNPFGFIETYGDNSPNGDGRWTTAGWQQDFYTAAFGYMLAMNPPVSAEVKTKIAQFFAWKAKSIVGRLGGTGASEWLYRDAAPYTMTLATNDSPDWATGTGPWPANWRELYNLTYDGSANSNAVPGPFEDGPLRGGNIPSAGSYWGNLQPAIAYAVEHGVAGAALALSRMTSASNWGALRSSLDVTPVWAVMPAV
jgi:hypothetical protein